MYSASDFDGAWTNCDSGSSTKHRRHILDKEVIAKVLNIGDIQLSSDEFNALKKVINDASVNKDPYDSKSANVGNSEKYAEKNGCSKKVVCDTDAVNNVLKSFSTAEKVYLPDHEASKIDKQVDVLLSEKFKNAVSPTTYEKICASYQLLTANVYAKESVKFYDGKVVDGRKFKFVSKQVKDSIKANVVKYLKNNELKSKESEQNTAKAAENSSKQEYNQVKESNYEKYTAVVPYSKQGSSSRGGESGGMSSRSSSSIDTLSNILHQLSIADRYSNSSSSISSSYYNDSYYYPSHYTSSISSSSSPMNSHPTTHNHCGTRASSSWDVSRAECKGLGMTRAQISEYHHAKNK